jgi:response regulator of citrate/malate metabolism
MQAGAIHYIVKPFTFASLRERLESYASLRQELGATHEPDQADIDRLFSHLRRPPRSATPLPKGHSVQTAARITESLQAAGDALSAAEVAGRTGLSRATAQRYLAVLAQAGTLELTLRYGTAGRPEHRYRLPS